MRKRAVPIGRPSATAVESNVPGPRDHMNPPGVCEIYEQAAEASAKALKRNRG